MTKTYLPMPALRAFITPTHATAPLFAQNPQAVVYSRDLSRNIKQVNSWPIEHKLTLAASWYLALTGIHGEPPQGVVLTIDPDTAFIQAHFDHETPGAREWVNQIRDAQPLTWTCLDLLPMIDHTDPKETSPEELFEAIAITLHTSQLPLAQLAAIAFPAPSHAPTNQTRH